MHARRSVKHGEPFSPPRATSMATRGDARRTGVRRSETDDGEDRDHAADGRDPIENGSHDRVPVASAVIDREVAQVVRTLEPERPVQIDLSGRAAPRVTFFSSGHVLGAAGILVEHHGRRIFYTGDTCTSGQYILGPARYPQGPVDLLLLDSTHGADPQPNFKKDRRAFGRATAELGTFISEVAARNGVVLMPVFALGRTQEMLGVLCELGQRGKIPPLPIYISGLAHAM